MQKVFKRHSTLDKMGFQKRNLWMQTNEGFIDSIWMIFTVPNSSFLKLGNGKFSLLELFAAYNTVKLSEGGQINILTSDAVQCTPGRKSSNI